MMKKTTNDNDSVYTESYFSEFIQSSILSAEIIVPLVSHLISPRSVVDVGCGLGAWISVFKRHGVSRVLGLDGDYVNRAQLLIEEDEFRPIDLRVPFQLEEKFDLALCLEVAEHLPSSCAKGLIESLAISAPFVLFSGATPGQGGADHINLQWPDYWERLFNSFGYICLDPPRPLIWQDNRVAWWYRQNAFLYADEQVVRNDEKLQELAETKKQNELMLIHTNVLAANLSLRYSLKRWLISKLCAMERLLRQKLPAFAPLAHYSTPQCQDYETPD